MRSGETDIGLIKLTKNTRLIIGVNTRTGICDSKPELLPLICVGEACRDRNAALIGKLHCVANQIEQDLTDSARISDHNGRHCRINGEAQQQAFLRCGL